MAFEYAVFGATLTLGGIAAGFFWRVLGHIEKKVCGVGEKVDHIIENMIRRDDCLAHREEMTASFNGHFHTPDGGLAVIRRGHGDVQQGPEEVPRSRYIKLPKVTGENVG